MNKLISINDMRTIAANMDDQGDHRYSHREVRRLLKEQDELALKSVGEWLDKVFNHGKSTVSKDEIEALKKGKRPWEGA